MDVIHTDGTLGIQVDIGHMDFYPNGGKMQTSCSITTTIPGLFDKDQTLKPGKSFPAFLLNKRG